MDITVIGGGYVGLVTAGVLSAQGHTVLVVERDPRRMAVTEKGEAPFHEPGLSELLRQGVERGRVHVCDRLPAELDTDVVIFAVGTPSAPSGAHDLTALQQAVAELQAAVRLSRYFVAVVKSTVPVGTGDWLEEQLRKTGLEPGKHFDVVSVPEFLRQGDAVQDALHPSRVVIGARKEATRALEMTISVFGRPGAPVLAVDRASAEMIKCASNAFLAVRLSLINEIARLCEAANADVKLVAQGMGMDKRIGRSYLEAGWGFGGSCLPKDTAALVYLGSAFHVETPILSAALSVNRSQQLSAVARLEAAIGSLDGRTVAVLGLSFKPQTDDLREAPSLRIIPAVQSAGARVRVHDPVVRPAAAPQLLGVDFCDSAPEACEGADALLIVTDWDEYRKLDWLHIRRLMRQPVIVDGRNMFDPNEMAAQGFRYFGVGRVPCTSVSVTASSAELHNSPA